MQFSSAGICSTTHHDKNYTNILEQYSNITKSFNISDTIKHNAKHHIRTAGPPVYSTPWHLLPEKYTYAKWEFQQMIKDRIIKSSESPYASPLYLVPKPGSKSFCVCVDYWWLNASTITDHYPVPQIHDLTLGLQDTTEFSKMDLTTRSQ